MSDDLPRVHRTIREEIRSLVVNPFTTVLCLLIIVSSALRQPASNSQGGGTIVGNLLNGWRGRVSRSLLNHRFDPVTIYLIREGTATFRALDPDVDSWDELSRLSGERPQDLFEVTYRCSIPLEGLWSVTRSGVRETISISSFTGRPTGGELVALRKEAATALGRKTQENLSSLAVADVQTTVAVHLGYAENSLVLLSALLCCLSMRWMPATWRRWRTVKGRRRVRLGQCAACGYSLTGIVGNSCPECGVVAQEKTPA